MKKSIYAMMLGLSLSACGSQGIVNPQLMAESPKAQEAKLVISRDSSLYGFLAPVNVSLNGKRVASLARGASVVVMAKSGENNLTVASAGDFGNFVSSFKAESGKTYVFEVSPSSSTGLRGAMWGPLGELVHAQAVENTGTFQLTLKDVR